MSGGLQSNIDSENEERKNEADWSPPPVSDSEKDVSLANGPRNYTKDPGSKSNRESSSEGEISSCFQRSRPPLQMAERKDTLEKKTQSTHQQHSSDQKCFTCAKEGYKCVGSYPFTEQCDSCRNQRRECFPQDEGQRKPQPAEEKCYPCRQTRLVCDGTFPFAHKCSSCKKRVRTCTAEEPEKPEKPEKGLPKHQKCQRCANSRSKCVGEPPFQNKCAACKTRNSKCVAQSVKVSEAVSDKKAVPNLKRVPYEERCIGCGWGRSCDGKRPCTACTKRTIPCSYEDGNERWTYQTDRAKWKTPTSPDCQACLQYNQDRSDMEVHCDGKFPCDCCLDDRVKTRATNCTYHYENGVSKLWKLEGERAQELRRQKAKWHGDRRRRKRMSRPETKDQNAQNESTDEDESLPDEDLLPNGDPLPNATRHKSPSESDSDRESNPDNYPDPANQLHPDDDDWDAGGDSSNKHANQHHDYDHEPDQGGEAADSPDDEDEWEEPESSGLKDLPEGGRGGREAGRLSRRGRGSWW